MRRALLLLIVVVSASRLAWAAPFPRLVDDYVDDCMRRDPARATYLGVHTFDARMQDLSRRGVEAERQALHGFLRRFVALDMRRASDLEKADRDLVVCDIQSRLLDLEALGRWKHDPDIYSSGASEAVFTLMSRRFAPPEARLRSVIAREAQIPRRLAWARANLVNPPRVFTEIAIEQLPGVVSFFEKDVPLAFKDVSDAPLLTRFREVNAAAVAALRDYERWLRDDLLPRSKGVYRIGPELFRRKLWYDEMVDIPLDRLLRIGYADLRRNQAAFKGVAARVDPKADPMQVLAAIARDHPPPDRLLQSFRDVLDGLVDFITRKEIVDLPSKVKPILEETPPFERATTMASMDTPGPFEHVAKEAYFNVTLPEPGWSPTQVAEHMAGFTYGTIISTATHEAYPGHYTQFLWLQRAPSKARKVFGAHSNAEGWAHYCEQMMLDEGYGNGDPKLRLGQLQDALLRNARYIVSIEMHAGHMTFQQAVDFFVREGYQSHANAVREAKRGTGDPTYLYYTLGKLELLKLRDDYRRKKGAAFSLREFHDRFLQQGYPPIRIVRRALLGDDSPVL